MSVHEATGLTRATHWLGTSLLAGAFAGLVLGSGVRVAMRVAAVAEGEETVFTVGGTVFLLLLGAAFGIVFGILYGAVRRWIPGRGRWKGLVFGFGLVLLGGLPLFTDPGGEARTIGIAWVNMVTFGGSLLGCGVTMELVWDRFRVPRGSRLAERAGAGALGGLVVGALVAPVIAGVVWLLWAPGDPETGATAPIVVMFVVQGGLIGAVLGLVHGLLRGERGRVIRSATITAALLIGLWVAIVAGSFEEASEEVPVGEVLSVVAAFLLVFSFGTSWVTEKILARSGRRGEPVGEPTRLPVG